MRRLIPAVLVVLALGLGFVVFRRAAGQTGARQQAPVGSAFTYQGQLDIDGAPADGTYDFRFTLFDAATGGSQVGSTASAGDVAVVNGRFSAGLDFGAGAFAGEARWLEIAVREGNSDGAYTPLAGRQPFTAAPYALHAAEAGSVAWADVQNRPPGLDDGDDDTTYTAGAGLALAGNTFSAEGSAYANVLVVAHSGGDFSSVQAALDSIGDAGADNGYLVFVAPGVYTETVTLKPYVTLKGAGEGRTILRGMGGSQSPTFGSDSATLIGADNAAVRHLTVESDGTGEDYAVAILNDAASPALSNVTASASGAGTGNFGVHNNSASPALSNVTASASTGQYNYGVYNTNAALPTMTDVSATAEGGTTANYGVYNGSSSAPAMTGVTASALGGSGSNYGVYNISSASPTMTNVTARAEDGSSNIGVRNFVCSATMTNVTATASGGSSSYGVYNYDSSTTIRHSTLEGSTASVSHSAGTMEVANSQLIGPIGGTGLTCFNNYDATLDPVICP